MIRAIAQLGILVALGLVTGVITNAQLIPDFSPLSLTATPPSPSPGQTVRVDAQTPTFNANTTTFSWRVNGRLRQEFSGQGKNSIELTAGDVGSRINVSVTVSRPNGFDNTETLTIYVSDVALIWFAETYTPKWYKGKALPTPDSVINIVAIPDIILDGRVVRPENLIYTWSVDDLSNALTGIGEQTFRIQSSDRGGVTHRIGLVMEDVQGKVQKQETIFIRLQDPLLEIYELSPLGGIEHRSSITARSVFPLQIIDLIVEPFFFPTAEKNSLSYTWTSQEVVPETNKKKPYVATFDPTQLSGQSPSTQVSATVKTGSPILPSTTKPVTLLFQ